MQRPFANARPFGPFIGKDPEQKAVYDTLTSLGLSAAREDLELDLDATFGGTVRWWQRRCLFKKTTSNSEGHFAIPAREAQALELKDNTRMNFLMINLNTQDFTRVWDKPIVPVTGDVDREYYYRFTVNENEISRITGRNLGDAPPIQFVGASITNNDRLIAGNVREPQGNTRFLANNLALYKDIVKRDESGIDGELYVTIEQNATRYFDMTPGQDIRVSAIPLLDDNPYASTRSFIEGSAYITEVKSADNTSRLYLGDLVDEVDGLEQGVMAQCIVNPNP